MQFYKSLVMVRLTFVCMEWWHSLAALYASTFLRPLNCPRNSIIDWIFKLNLWGAKWYSTGSTLKPNLNPNPKLWFCCEKQQNCKKKKKSKVLQHTILGNSSYPQVSAHYHTKHYLTCKHDILQTCGYKDGHIKMAAILKICFTFAAQLA